MKKNKPLYNCRVTINVGGVGTEHFDIDNVLNWAVGSSTMVFNSNNGQRFIFTLDKIISVVITDKSRV